MKRWLILLLAVFFSLSLVACGGSGGDDTPKTDAPTTDAPTTDAPAASTPAESEPEASEPAESEPEASEPAESEPAESEPEESEPAQSEPETSDPGTDGPEVHLHTPVHVAAKLPTCTEEGNVEYYYCADCSLCFSDAECKNSISSTVVSPAGHAWDDGVAVQELTCTSDAEIKHTCGTCGTTKMITVSTEGHAWDGARTCERGHECTRCNTVEPALTHEYRVTDSSEGNCTTAPFKTYTCANDGCGDTYTDVLGTAAGHVTTDVTPTERPVSGCEYVLIYECSVCHEDVEGDHVFRHSHKASITKAATCDEDGVKTLTCACGDSYTLPIEKNATGHDWKQGESVGNKRTDTCEICGETKSVTVVTGNVTDKTAASDFANTEIEVNNAGVSLDQGVIDALGEKEVTLSVGKLEGEDRKNLGLDEEKLAQVGNSPIYDFTINDGEKNISEFGEDNWVTITLPYTLEENEDVDSIAVWFINDKGELEAIDAVYNNGFVTFRTNHFSYYTVTRLTPAQRCEAWGHNYKDTKVAASCVSDGYTLSVCSRCHDTVKTVTEKAWGHKCTETVIPATCVKSGSIISRCEKCGDSYASRIPATGHTWLEAERVDATCEGAGYVLYVCNNADCGTSYKDVLPVLRHDYTERVVAPTCTAAGYTEHACRNCSYSHRDTYTVPLGHELTETVTPPTCTEEGYTAHTCLRCDYVKVDSTVAATGHKLSVKETPATCDKDGSRDETCANCDYKKSETIPAVGHDYEAKWEWGILRDAAKLYLTCRRDKSHVMTVEATVVIETTEATCEADGVRLYTATAEHGGNIYTDVKEEVLPKLQHSFGTSCENGNDKEHWQVCTVCGTPDKAFPHDFGAWETVTEPTCVKAGERVAVCNAYMCEYTKREAIPATGEHVYAGGVCTGCGKAEDVVGCDHTLSEKLLDLGAYGCCEGTFLYYACDCGEVVTLPEDETLATIGCELEVVRMESGVASNSYVMEFACDVCGLRLLVTGTITSEECVQTQIGYYTFVLGDKILLENARYETSGVHHDHRGSEEIDLSEYGFCGGYATVYRCGVCGIVLDFENIYPACKTEVKLSTYVDADSIEHTVYTLDCDVCPLVLTRDSWRAADSACEYADCSITTMKNGNEEIFSVEDTIYYSSHNFEAEYKLLGESCEDGVLVYSYCDGCGESEEREIDWHPYVEGVVIDLGEYTECGGYAEMERCTICGDVSWARADFFCRFGERHEEIVEDNGISHLLITETCRDCGLTVFTDEWGKWRTDCVEIRYESVRVVLDGKELFAWTDEWEVGHHAFAYDYTLDGEVCGEGYSFTAVCTACGEKQSGGGWGHPTKDFYIDLSDYGFCGGEFCVQQCVLCGVVTRVDDFHYDCNYKEVTFTEETDEAGVLYTVESAVCTECQIKLSVYESKEHIGNCEYRVRESYALTGPDGTVIFEFIEADQLYVEHTWSYTFSDGASCHYDDYTVYATCTVCGETEELWASGHFMGDSTEGYDLGDLGACGGDLYFDKCELCGDEEYELYCDCWFEIASVDEYFDENGNRHHLRFQTCEACGFTYTYDSWTESAGQCKKRQYEELHISDPNGNVVASAVACYEYDNHNTTVEYVPAGESCETDGYWMYVKCNDCDYTWEGFDYGCRYEDVEIDLSELGMCGGTVYVSMCIACGDVRRISDFDWCDWDYLEDLSWAWGCEVYVCRWCNTMRIESVEIGEKDENCTCTEHRSLSYQRDGITLAEFSSVRRYTEHAFVYEFECFGESCDDGFIVRGTCACGETLEEEYYWHQSFTIAHYELSEYGACSGYFTVIACPCGQDHRVEYDPPRSYVLYEDSFTDDDGVYHTYTRYRCECCNTDIVCDRIQVKSGCTVAEYEIYTVRVGVETLVSEYSVYKGSNEAHDYEYSFKLHGESCEDGVTVYERCTACGASYENYIDWHEYFLAEYVDLEALGACYGYFEHSICPCGMYEFSNYNYCYDQEHRDRYVDEAGVVHEITTYLCSNCSTVVTCDRYQEKIGCKTVTWDCYTVMVNGETVIDGLKLRWAEREEHDFAYSFKLHGKSCEDGVTVYEICEDCGVSYEEYIEYHRQYTVDRIELADFGACYGYFEESACPCGKDTLFSTDFCCDDWWHEKSYTDGDGVLHYVERKTCSACGLDARWDTWTVKDGCYGRDLQLWTIRIGETVVIEDRIVVASISQEHDYKFTFDMYGESCYDGFTAYGVCDCGATYEEYYSWHATFPTERYDLTDYGACYGMFEASACPCGYETGFYSHFCYSHCEYSYVTDAYGRVHEIATYLCGVCGLKTVCDSYEIEDGCARTGAESWSAYIGKNEDVIFEGFAGEGSVWYVHDYVYDFELYGESCEDGYTVYGFCACGDTSEIYSDWHQEFLLERYDLSAYGACNGAFVELFSCPCGYSAHLSYASCEDAQFENEVITDASGNHRYCERIFCDTCGLQILNDHYRSMEGCLEFNVFDVTVTIGDTEIVSFSYVTDYFEAHDYFSTYTLLGESCEDGVYAERVCTRCGESYDETYYWHYTAQDVMIDYGGEGKCYLYVNFNSCACGENRYEYSHFDYDDSYKSTYTDDDGILHTVWLYTCSKCGLRYEQDSYTVRDAATCTEISHYSVVINVGGELLGSFEYTDRMEAHNMMTDVELLPGADSCTDGFSKHVFCTDCDYSYEDVYYGHDCFLETVYDLGEYGSVCGGSLVISTCPCGEFTKGYTRDMQCDFDWSYADAWIEGTVDYGSWNDYTCAVTDPACAFTYRCATYYLPGENCTAVQYECWVLGYDPVTGDYKEMIVYPTGNTTEWHNWVNDYDFAGEDELGAWVGYKTECTVCGIGESEKRYYDADGDLVHEICEWVKSYANGKKQSSLTRRDFAKIERPDGSVFNELIYELNRTSYEDGTYYEDETFYTYDFTYKTELGDWGYLYTESRWINGEEADCHELAQFFYMGYLYPVYEFRSFHYGENWERTEYTYDPMRICYATRIYTDSFGSKDESSVEFHNEAFGEEIGTPTCSQSGIYRAVCNVCHEVVEEWKTAPYGHHWRYDYEGYFYYCSRCGIENDNGADGEMILEDLSEDYGNGESYVVGYFSWGDVAYDFYVSIKLLDEDGIEIGKDIILDAVYVTKHDELRAYVFSREEVARLAEEFGYGEGSYHVAFTFVPEGADGAFDYSITLTDAKHSTDSEKNPSDEELRTPIV